MSARRSPVFRTFPIVTSAVPSETERALVGALGRRCADPQPENRHPLDEAYAAAMREARKSDPEDAEVATLLTDAADAGARFGRPWARADVTLGSTCFCQPGG